MAERAKPQRTCLACRQMKDKRELTRVVRTPDGEIKLDDTGRMPGRGAYLCKEPECLKRVLKSRALERALKQPISEDVKNELLQKYAE
ncbi:MAG TPA: YlxR family protein [Candidatus Avidehalobacter gallistercoris]|uniref:YlxR family protein n=1 Tax=Candidatus Avidehalobacter gallistercoris TaxID=2840694 RepID=A0A9D1KYT9_9FIRM|nr:YlxR family protein [Candidatus Avidehalobacter gallistercoris]